jgi:hypothetical protein
VNEAVTDFVKNARLHFEYREKGPRFDSHLPTFPDTRPGDELTIQPFA